MGKYHACKKIARNLKHKVVDLDERTRRINSIVVGIRVAD